MPSDEYRPQSVWDLHMGPWTTAPRFYPPGQHPATAQWRQRIADLEMWEHLSVLATEGREMLDYCRQQVANFDAREAEIRADIDRQRWPDFLSNQIERL